MHEIISAQFRSRLEALETALRRTLPATWRGDRRSLVRKGISLEFSDHRAYVEGDDVRHLDWAGYARLDQLMVKVYHDEEDLELSVVLDDSASMAFGRPQKALFARQVAAALIWIGLANGHRVSLAVLGDTTEILPRAMGRGAAGRFFERLAAPVGASRAGLVRGVERFVSERRPRGIVVLISDLFDRAGPTAIMRPLEHPSRELDVLHVMSADEIDPPSDGDYRFKDSETGHQVEVHLADPILATYKKTVRAFLVDARETCKKRGSAYVHVTSDKNLEDFCLRTLVREGVLR